MKDYDAIAGEIYYGNEEAGAAGEIARIAAILRKHDEAEAGGEQYNRPADILAHLKDYPGARDRLIDLLANECWPRSFVADCFAKYDEIQSRPAPTDEKALSLGMDAPWPMRDCIVKLCKAADILLDQKSYDGHGHEEIATARNQARALLAREAPKDESK